MPTMMRDAAISFPLLGNWSIDPSASFTLFGRTFYWYGVIIAVGFILAMLYCARHCRRCGIEPDTLYDFLIWMIPLAIIGARLYYVIFQWSDYRDHPIDALKIWEGGLAIYGGVIAGLLTGIIWCRKKKIPFGAMADVCAPGLLIGQCIGRWGNFINREAFGRETTAFSRMGLTLPGRETVYVHPTFLYESLWNFVGFLLLHFWFRRHERKFDGELILLYAVWYGIGRALIEGLRTCTSPARASASASCWPGCRRPPLPSCSRCFTPASSGTHRAMLTAARAGSRTHKAFAVSYFKEVFSHERLS